MADPCNGAVAAEQSRSQWLLPVLLETSSYGQLSSTDSSYSVAADKVDFWLRCLCLERGFAMVQSRVALMEAVIRFSFTPSHDGLRNGT